MARVSGIVRRLDGLGRIVIPKEIRDRFDLSVKDQNGKMEGSPLEILVEDNGEIVLRKYEPSVHACDACGHVPELDDKPLSYTTNKKIKLCGACAQEITY